MINIYIDSIIFYLQKSGGISVYWDELVRRMLSDDLISLDMNYSPRWSDNIISHKYGITNKKVVAPQVMRYFDYVLPERKKIDITHTTYYRVPVKKKRSLIVNTVHDFTYEFYHSGVSKKVHSFQKRRAIKYSDGLIAISENTKRDLLKFNPDVDPQKIRVVYNGVSDEYHHIPRFDKDEYVNSYVLFVGARAGYKNFAALVQSLAFIDGIDLYIVGHELSKDEIGFLDKYIRNRYKVYSGVTNQKLNQLYNGAFAFIYPSLYEGFGIPIAEAMSAGCPVIAANASSIPEVAGKAALLLDGINSGLIADAICSLRCEKLRNKLVNLGFSQSNKFSWNKCYKETVSFYHYLLENNFA